MLTNSVPNPQIILPRILQLKIRLVGIAFFCKIIRITGCDNSLQRTRKICRASCEICNSCHLCHFPHKKSCKSQKKRIRFQGLRSEPSCINTSQNLSQFNERWRLFISKSIKPRFKTDIVKTFYGSSLKLHFLWSSRPRRRHSLQFLSQRF